MLVFTRISFVNNVELKKINVKLSNIMRHPKLCTYLFVKLPPITTYLTTQM